MEIEFDAAKNQANIIKHGIGLHLAEDFEWDSAIIHPDERKNYGESRFIALGFISSRLHVVIFTTRNKNLRIISLRKANERERKEYEKETL